MKIYLSLILIFTSLISCGSGVIKYQNKEDLPTNVVFYSDEKIFKIPLCVYKDSLYGDPDDCTITRSGQLWCDNIPEEISIKLSEIGTVIGDIKMEYHWPSYKMQNFYIIHDKNIGYLFIKKNIFGYRNFNKIKQSEYKTIVTGGVNGLVIDVDLYSARIINNGRSILFLVTLKNTSNNNITFNSATDTINLSFGYKQNKIKNQLFACNFCSLSSKDFVKEMLPSEENEFFAKFDFRNKNESVGIQMGIMFTKIIIDGLANERNNSESVDIKKVEKKLIDTWGGDFRIARTGEKGLLNVKIIAK